MIEVLDVSREPERFFNILPEDWRKEIEPCWTEYLDSANIVTLIEHSELIAGGIIFSTVSPDTKGYRKVAQQWLDKGYRYIGFLFVSEDRRMEGLGSLLVEKIKFRSAGQKYWLSIDDFKLIRFYNALGFELVKEVLKEGEKEWILKYEPDEFP